MSSQPITYHSLIHNCFSDINPSLIEFIQWVPFMTLRWRKFYVDVCQTQCNLRNSRIRASFESCFMHDIITDYKTTATRRLLEGFVEVATQSVFISSLVITILRSESHDVGVEMGRPVEEGILKELKACIDPKKPSIDYSVLFLQLSSNWSPYAPLSPSWKETAMEFVKKFSHICERFKGRILFPEVQRSRNMSQESCGMLVQDGYKTDEPLSLTTLDLERHYHRTGNQVLGENEMRWAWKFNDLKPRIYFTTGGRCYWKSRYMKRIAVDFMESCAMTTKLRRKFPDNMSRYVDHDDYIVFWDYAAFTTNLVELRYFLSYCALFLEHDPSVRQYPLRVFDYRHGILEVQLWDLLHQYNETVNLHCMFSIHRIIDELAFGSDMDFEVVMLNGGPLGVHGNIGFSTTLGGVHASLKATHRNAGVGMGDDIMAADKHDPTRKGGMVDHVQALGTVPESKFGIIPPTSEEIYEGWKFVKRPLRRDGDGIVLGALLPVPELATCAGIDHSMRKFIPKSKNENMLRFISQVSSLLWEVQQSTIVLSDMDLRLLEQYLRIGYRKFGLNVNGSLPGYKSFLTQEMIPLAVPCINFGHYLPNEVDWADYLWEHAPQQFCMLAMRTGSHLFLDDSIGTQLVTDHKANRILVDLGYAEIVKVAYELVEVNEVNYRRFRQSLSGYGQRLSIYRVFSFPHICRDLRDFYCVEDIRSDYRDYAQPGYLGTLHPW